jgi:hypothetical protein
VILMMLVWGSVAFPVCAQVEPTVSAEEALKKALDEMRGMGVSLSQEAIDEMHSSVRTRRLPPRTEGAEWFTEMVRAGANPQAAAPISRVVGKEGIPFPKAEEVVQRPTPTPHVVAGETATPEPVWSPKPLVLPSRCEKNETTREVRDPDSKEEELVADVLFIPKDLVPLDPDEVLGPNVSLVVYEHAPNDTGLYRAALLDLPCLPLRIRVTNVASYQDTGVNAFKKRTGAQAGEGTLHPVMQDKLFGRKGGARSRNTAAR